MKSSDTGGVKPMPIAGRFKRERERVFQMTPEDRKWRGLYIENYITLFIFMSLT